MPQVVKALTLAQPWAALVTSGAKRVETRSWRTRYRGLLAIHAARGFPVPAQRLCTVPPFSDHLRAAGTWPPEALPRGCVVATCRLAACERITRLTLPPEPERSFGNYADGRWAWLLEDVRPLAGPLPAKGALGLWEWDEGEGPPP